MAQIAPTITSGNPEDFKKEIERVESFSQRLHIDLADGHFAPSTLINPAQVWWPDGAIADIHIMFERPEEILETLISLEPSLIIFQAESQGDLAGMIEHLKDMEFRTGIAMLKETSVESANGLVEMVDHVLIFSGSLGYHGGKVQFSLLEKVAKAKEINPGAEIGWDGGINDSNAAQLVQGGVDVLNVGGFIQNAEDPASAYRSIQDKLS
ncbi:MAG: hypothetical protein R3313_04975 [Candidatus Saccharimonadales bacterium]|nr:hypothetical protein [Candidatus Saccharimonadales bacterium]